jgi:hypothetical protein
MVYSFAVAVVTIVISIVIIFFQFASMNATGQCVAVAGKCGLAHCALYARKWKLFGNETQVDNFVLSLTFKFACF